MHACIPSSLNLPPQKSTDAFSHRRATLSQLALFKFAQSLTELMLFSFGVFLPICSPVQILISVKTNTVPGVKPQPGNLHGSGAELCAFLFFLLQLSWLAPAQNNSFLLTASASRCNDHFSPGTTRYKTNFSSRTDIFPAWNATYVPEVPVWTL